MFRIKVRSWTMQPTPAERQIYKHFRTEADTILVGESGEERGRVKSDLGLLGVGAKKRFASCGMSRISR